MATNEQNLFENSLRAKMGNRSTSPSDSLVLVAGVSAAFLDGSKTAAAVNVDFGGLFANTPIVVGTPYAPGLALVLGFSMTSVGVNGARFRVQGWRPNNKKNPGKIDKSVKIFYHALGKIQNNALI